jgi:outer membrane protein OmpA-like peptidoglycan-associated protein
MEKHRNFKNILRLQSEKVFFGIIIITFADSFSQLIAQPAGNGQARDRIPIFSSMNECEGAGSYTAKDPNLIIANPTPVYIAQYGEFPNSIAPAYPVVASQDWIFSPPQDKIPLELQKSLRGEELTPTPAQIEQQNYNKNSPDDSCAVAPVKEFGLKKDSLAKLGNSRYLDAMFTGIKSDFSNTGFAFNAGPDGIEGDGISLRKITEDSPTGPVTKALVFIIDGNVSFKTGSSELTSVALKLTAKVSRAMAAYPETEAEVSGHTDSRGSYDLNKKLSLDRARSVSDELIQSHSLDPKRILNITGSADDRKVIHTNEAEPANRRVEIRLIPIRIK